MFYLNPALVRVRIGHERVLDLRNHNCTFVMLRTFLHRPREERQAWLLWLTFFVVLAVGIASGSGRSVTYQYSWAAERWLQGVDIYEMGGRGFLYLPQAALLYLPFNLLPHVAGEIGWRLITLGTFAAGVYRLTRLAETNGGGRLFLITTCLTIPLSFSAARNGQATLVMAGLMMLSLDELTQRRWTRAAVLLCLGLAFKPLTFVLMLVVAAIYRPMLVRLAIGTVVLALLPFFTQEGSYVLDQYAGFAGMLRSATQLGIDRPWAQLFGMLQIAGISLPEPIQTLFRVTAAGATLIAGWWVHRRLPASRCALYLYALAGCYLMLFNPRTENNTYALIAPALGVFCGEAFRVERNRVLGCVLILFALGTVCSYEIGTRLTPGVHPVWLAPLMCVGFSLVLLGQLIGEVQSQEEVVAAASPPLGACLPHRFAS